MVKYVIALLFSVSTLQAQSTVDQQSTIEIGDTYKIGNPENNKYKHINFPRANFIIKRGGIANFNAIPGNLVEITAVKEKADGTTEVKLKRKDGKRFFGSHKVIEADIYAAVNSGELQAK
ncbi:hypothetical protein GH721_05570 [Kriegella sp. EG-1]|nr:hypothetical protein [Flavobacteriaceae bacterium EG-1]